MGSRWYKFDKVLEAFEQFCAPQKNILYECHGFWSSHQEEGEAIDAYITRLKLRIDSCEYDKTGWPPAVKLELTRDKFIFGLLDDALKERLLREVDLSLQRAVSLAQRSESSKTQAKEMSIQSITTFQCDEVKQWSCVGSLKGQRNVQPLDSTVQSAINSITLPRCVETRDFLSQGCQIPLKGMCLLLTIKILAL